MTEGLKSTLTNEVTRSAAPRHRMLRLLLLLLWASAAWPLPECQRRRVAAAPAAAAVAGGAAVGLAREGRHAYMSCGACRRVRRLVPSRSFICGRLALHSPAPALLGCCYQRQIISEAGEC